MLLYLPFENIALSFKKEKTNYNLSNNDLSVLKKLLLQKKWDGNISVRLSRDNQSIRAEKIFQY